MMTRAISFALILTGAVASGGPRGGRSADLPFYADRDFTPHWSPVEHRVGTFSLTSQTGASFTDRDVTGRVYVASFVYTRCSVICPAIVANLRRVQAAAPAALLVSFSVTPELDSPAVLSAFGAERGIDPLGWTLVTGDKRQIYALARDAYFADDDRLAGLAGGADSFLHTEKVVLVDGGGRLRGVYDATQRFDMDKLIEDVQRLTATSATFRT